MQSLFFLLSFPISTIATWRSNWRIDDVCCNNINSDRSWPNLFNSIWTFQVINVVHHYNGRLDHIWPTFTNEQQQQQRSRFGEDIGKCCIDYDTDCLYIHLLPVYVRNQGETRHGKTVDETTTRVTSTRRFRWSRIAIELCRFWYHQCSCQFTIIIV